MIDGMNFLKQINKNSIIVTNYSYKEAILKEISKNKMILPIKFLTMETLLNDFFFSYDELTIAFVMEKYGFSYDNSLMYIKNLYFINGSKDIGPISFLLKLKKDLLENNLLYYKDLSYLYKNDIYFVGFPYFKKIEEYVIEKLKEKTNVKIISLYGDTFEHSCYEFDTIFDEVSFVASKISSLVTMGVPFEKIKLTNISSDYNFILKKIFSFFNIPISFGKSIYGLEIAKDFLDYYDNYDLLEVIEKLNDKYPNEKDVINKIVNICNKYVRIDNKIIKKEFIIKDLKNTNFDILPSIKVISYLDDVIFDDDYIFLLNFNVNEIPKMIKDEDYITDFYKENTLLDMTVDLNIKIKNATLKRLKTIRNLAITYKKSTPFRTFFPSSLSEYFILRKDNDIDYTYSKKYARQLLASYLDDFLKYGTVNEKMSLLFSNDKEIPYKTYDNSYSKIKSDILETKSYNLSYSSMDIFYKCPFRYYLSNVLKIDIFEFSFASYLGSLFHYVLQNNLQNGTAVNTLVDKFIKENEFDLDERCMFFIDKARSELEFILDTIKLQYQDIGLDKAMYEKRIVIPLNSDGSITFKGFVDKLLYKEQDNSYIVAIIDYKTGVISLDLSLISHGLNLQLPSYLYLISHDENLKSIKFAGFYLQKILSDVLPIKLGKQIVDEKRNNLKLYGYSNSNQEILHEFDKSYKDSRVIKSMGIKNDGSFNSYAKVLDEKDFDTLISIVDEKIKNTVKKIEDKDFVIEPKRINEENVSCTFCKFRDICFRKEEDFKELKADKELSFLGGDVDA